MGNVETKKGPTAETGSNTGSNNELKNKFIHNSIIYKISIKNYNQFQKFSK